MSIRQLHAQTLREQVLRIHSVARNFVLEDVWALPVSGDLADFDRLIAIFTSFDPARWHRSPTKFLWEARDRMGQVLGLGRISRPSDTRTLTRLAAQLPDDLRNSASDLRFGSLPFTPLYRTKDEFAAELSNATVNGIMHLAWIQQQDDNYHGQMAVYVQPHGLGGRAYMALIRPFRRWIVYPALGRQVQYAWETGRTHL